MEVLFPPICTGFISTVPNTTSLLVYFLPQITFTPPPLSLFVCFLLPPTLPWPIEYMSFVLLFPYLCTTTYSDTFVIHLVEICSLVFVLSLY